MFIKQKLSENHRKIDTSLTVNKCIIIKYLVYKMYTILKLRSSSLIWYIISHILMQQKDYKCMFWNQVSANMHCHYTTLLTASDWQRILLATCSVREVQIGDIEWNFKLVYRHYR